MKISIKSSNKHGKRESENKNRDRVDTAAEVLRESEDDDDGNDGNTGEKRGENLRQKWV